MKKIEAETPEPVNPMNRDKVDGETNVTITFDQSSIVNTKTGEVSNPDELLRDLRAIERAIQTVDGVIEEKQSELKLLKEQRNGYVRAILDRVRSSEVQTLPLFDDKAEETPTLADA